MDEHLRRAAGHEDLGRLVPDQAGVFWIAIDRAVDCGHRLFAAAASAQFRSARLAGRRLVFLGLAEVVRRDAGARIPARTCGRCLRATVLVSLWLAVRAVWVRLHPYTVRWQPAASERALAGVAIGVTVLSLATVFLRAPDDSSYFSNLGGQRLRETGLLPYGDPLLTGTPGAAYAPGMYFLHAATQSLLMQPANIGKENLSLATLNECRGLHGARTDRDAAVAGDLSTRRGNGARADRPAMARRLARGRARRAVWRIRRRARCRRRSRQLDGRHVRLARDSAGDHAGRVRTDRTAAARPVSPWRSHRGRAFIRRSSLRSGSVGIRPATGNLRCDSLPASRP